MECFQKCIQIPISFPVELNNKIETIVFNAETNQRNYDHIYLFYQVHLTIIFLLARNKSALLRM